MEEVIAANAVIDPCVAFLIQPTYTIATWTGYGNIAQESPFL
jgi:hypothetical protein